MAKRTTKSNKPTFTISSSASTGRSIEMIARHDGVAQYRQSVSVRRAGLIVTQLGTLDEPITARDAAARFEMNYSHVITAFHFLRAARIIDWTPNEKTEDAGAQITAKFRYEGGAYDAFCAAVDRCADRSARLDEFAVHGDADATNGQLAGWYLTRTKTPRTGRKYTHKISFPDFKVVCDELSARFKRLTPGRVMSMEDAIRSMRSDGFNLAFSSFYVAVGFLTDRGILVPGPRRSTVPAGDPDGIELDAMTEVWALQHECTQEEEQPVA